jgi:hypothetical protein
MYGKTTISLTGRRGSVSGIENISFSSTFFIALQDGFNELRAGGALDKREDHNLPSGSLYRFPSYGFLFGPIPSFDEDMREKQRDQVQGSGLIKDRDIINTPETGKDLRPLLIGENWPVGTLQAPDRSIAIDSNDQNISKGLGFFQITDMSDMEKVETAVREDDPFPLSFQVLDDSPEVLSLLDFFSHLQLLFKSYQI